MKVYQLSEINTAKIQEVILLGCAGENNFKGYIEFTDKKCLLWNGRTLAGSKVIVRSLKTGRFVNHSIGMITITRSISNALRIEIY